ncbi:MAG: D-2-hydroxyacid dehydrogenase [Sinobacteraceae bacterium]|nr:D-2-hydroxyacid dehydrogenase [Nevskiaceae bacterium]
MSAVFLDFSTLSVGDLDIGGLQATAPGLRLREMTAQDDVAATIADCEIVMLNKLQMPREVIANTPALKLIALAATGTNNVDLSAAHDHGVAVCNITDYCTASVVQHVLGVLLSLTQKLPQYSRDAVDGTWAKSPHFTRLVYPIRELRGRTLGIVGYGVLGRAVADACRTALGMQVIVAQRTADGEHTSGDDRVPLDELLARADVVSLHCPLTPATTGLINAARLRLMKPDAILINTARGGLVDVEALAQALRAGQIGGAAIDVLPREPPVDGSPLFAPDLPNLIVTPHTAWAARESRQRALDQIAANIEAWRRGERLRRVV